MNAVKAALVGLIPALALATQGTSDRDADALLGTLRRAAARDDRAGVAALVQFPITVLVGGLRVPIRDAAEFVAQYDVLLTPLLKDVIARGPVGTTDGGLTIGSYVTIRSIGGVWKITNLTVPRTPESASAGPPRAPDIPARPAAPPRRQPRRLLFRAGQPTIQVAGTLARGATESYVTWAAKNRLLEVRVDGVRGREVVARIVDAKTGAALDARSRDGVRAWAGRVPAAADYRIDVVRVAGEDDLLAYRLALTLR